MDYYQGVILEYLRADKALFVNPECCIQLNDAANPDNSGKHWYCDLLAVDLRTHTVWLGEVSYSRSLGALLRRLREWNEHWNSLKAALVRDSKIDPTWQVRPWLFVPSACLDTAVPRIHKILQTAQSQESMPPPRITTLEAAAPWNFVTWNRIGERDDLKPASIPPEMRT